MNGSYLDRSDVALLHLLLRDSRTSPEQMAEATGLQVGAISKRIEAMSLVGVIGKFTTKPSLVSIGASSILVWGKSRLNSLEDAMQMATANDRIAWLAHSTSGRFYVALHIQKAEELPDQIRKVEAEAMMLRPSYATRELFDADRGRYRYNSLDWRIIDRMREDSTMDTNDLALMLGAKHSEVEDRLERMLGSGALDLSIELDLNNISNPQCLFHLESLDPEGRQAAAGEIMTRHAPSLLFFNTYANMRQLCTSMAIAQDWDEIRDMARSFRERKEFPFVEVNPILSSVTLDTWRDKLVRSKAAGARK
jgi:DNA-binding Lrp family transcriptional regulator